MAATSLDIDIALAAALHECLEDWDAIHHSRHFSAELMQIQTPEETLSLMHLAPS
jgi:hypothetical protein